MKLLTTILALACSSALLCSAAWAQGDPSGTYRGSNGPQGDQQPGSAYNQSPAPDNFVANVYGAGNSFTLEVMPPGGDRCGRPFYFRANITFQANQPIASISGPMLRCTYQDLKDACANVGVTLTDYYQVIYTGTFDRTTGIITITYPFAIWVREDCKEARTAQGRETIMLNYTPPTPPAPTTTQTIGDILDDIEQIAIDSFWTLGGLVPRL